MSTNNFPNLAQSAIFICFFYFPVVQQAYFHLATLLPDWVKDDC
ncbi:MAG: hypothetical protein ACRC10_04385 [Thermoguttaceae bacterium]